MSGSDRGRVQPLPTETPAALAATPPTHRWLVDRLWARSGVGILGGTPKSFKTWLGLEIATAVATATPCLGRFDVRAPGPVLIYLAEDGLGTVRERLDALARARHRALGDLDMRVITAPTLRLDRADDMRRLAATVRDVQPRLLVLDPLVRLHGADENNATEIATILSRLRVLQRHYDVAVLVVHHTRKQGSGRQHGQALRGSGDLHAWGDSNLYLTHERAGVKLTAEHRAAPAPDSVLVTLQGDPPRLVPHDVEDKPEQRPLEDRIVEQLRLADGPLSRKRLRAALAVNNQRLGDALLRLEALGALRRTSDGWAI